MSVMVVYVHGLWLNGWEAAWLRRRLSRELSSATCAFPYPSVTAGLATNARALAAFLARIHVDTLHLVGHSLGGLVILECLESVLRARGSEPRDGPLPPGRIVLLASPVRGSLAARRLARWPFGRKIMGLTAGEVLLEPRARQWSGARDLGIIAGNRPLGAGHLLGRFHAPNDGTVLLEETRLAGAREHLQLRVSHSGMVLSAEVAMQTAAFLRDGRFARQQ
jgi:pimeloyl-ACP methyl ester carboxylesterase